MNKYLLLVPYFAMIIVGLMLPSDGNHGLFTPKSLAFLSSSLVIGLYMLHKQKVTPTGSRLILFFLYTLSFLLIWLIVNTIYDRENYANALDQLKLFLITVVFILSTLYIVEEQLVDPRTILKAIIYANFGYSFAKVFLLILHLGGFVNMFDVTKSLGIRFMSMAIFGGIVRLQTSVDIITPFLFFFVLQSKKLELGLSKRFRFMYIAISTLSIFLSFSRFLMMIGIASYLLYLCTLSLYSLSRKVLFLVFLLLCSVFLIGIDNIETMIEQRFFSKANYVSDLTRKEQIDALVAQFYETPYLGIGLGGHAEGMIRDESNSHSYEVQWIAFLMQFGLVGIVLMLIPCGIISSNFIFTSFSRLKLTCFMLFILWLLSGFTNPFLISLTSGIVYSLFLLSALIINKKQICVI